MQLIRRVRLSLCNLFISSLTHLSTFPGSSQPLSEYSFLFVSNLSHHCLFTDRLKWPVTESVVTYTHYRSEASNKVTRVGTCWGISAWPQFSLHQGLEEQKSFPNNAASGPKPIFFILGAGALLPVPLPPCRAWCNLEVHTSGWVLHTLQAHTYDQVISKSGLP